MSTILINGKRVQPMVLFELDIPPHTEETEETLSPSGNDGDPSIA